MPTKKTAKKATKKTTKKTPAKKTAKAAAKTKKTKVVAKKKATAKIKKGQAYECHVCGLRVVVDEVCGCVEEHALICCMKPMEKRAK